MTYCFEPCCDEIAELFAGHESHLEHVHNNAASYPEDEFERNRVESCKAVLAGVYYPQKELRDEIKKELNPCGFLSDVFELGYFMDQGVRPSPIYEHMFDGSQARQKEYFRRQEPRRIESSPQGTGRNRRVHPKPSSFLANLAREPGELAPCPAWLAKVESRWKESGIPTEFPTVYERLSVDQRIQDIREFDRLIDRAARIGLDALEVRIRDTSTTPPRIKEPPFWDADARELRVGEQIIKRYRHPAENQTKILAAFQEVGWSSRIDDPLPRKGKVPPKRRLRDTVRDLNEFRCIRFSADGTGEGIRWEWDCEEDLPLGRLPV